MRAFLSLTGLGRRRVEVDAAHIIAIEAEPGGHCCLYLSSGALLSLEESRERVLSLLEEAESSLEKLNRPSTITTPQSDPSFSFSGFTVAQTDESK